MRRIYVLMLVLVLSLSLFTGCLGKPQIVNPGDDYVVSDIDKNITAKVKITVPNASEEQDIIKKVRAEFNKEFPNVTINIDSTNKGAVETIMDYYRVEQSKPGTMPDMFFCTSFDMQYLGEEGLLLNLEPLIRNSVNKGTFNLDDYYEEMWNLGKFNFTGNKQYLVPRSADRVVTHINKKIFNDAGVDMNPETTKVKNGWTWQDFLDTCAKLRTYYDSKTKEQDPIINKEGFLIDAYFSWEAVFNPMLIANGANTGMMAEILR